VAASKVREAAAFWPAGTELPSLAGNRKVGAGSQCLLHPLCDGLNALRMANSCHNHSRGNPLGSADGNHELLLAGSERSSAERWHMADPECGAAGPQPLAESEPAPAAAWHVAGSEWGSAAARLLAQSERPSAATWLLADPEGDPTTRQLLADSESAGTAPQLARDHSGSHCPGGAQAQAQGAWSGRMVAVAPRGRIGRRAAARGLRRPGP
jgi:hypothetical protein